MKYLQYVLALFLISMSALLFSQPAENNVDANGKKQGYWKKYNDKKELLYEGQFKNDVPVGEFKYYYSNGKLKSRSFFIQGTHKVRTIIYHENEKKAAEGLFVDQIKDSIWNYYNSEEQLITVESYKKGKKEGHWATYSSQTGILLEEWDYSDDVLNGKHKTYFVDGNLNTTISYINGKMNGVIESYYPNKNIYIRGIYHEDNKEKNWDFYDEEGHIRKTIEYAKSKVVNTYLYLYNGSNGQKLNQNLIAYFHKVGDQSQAVMRNGKFFNMTESFEKVCQFLDFVDFFIINPSYAAAYDVIMDYKELGEGDDEIGNSDAIEVILKPAAAEPVIAEGDHAQQVKALFVKELPKE